MCVSVTTQYLEGYPDFINYVQCGGDTLIFFTALFLRQKGRLFTLPRAWKQYAGIGALIALNGVAFQVCVL